MCQEASPEVTGRGRGREHRAWDSTFIGVGGGSQGFADSLFIGEFEI